MKNVLKLFLKDATIIDEVTKEEKLVSELLQGLMKRVEILEKENVGMANALYEIENRLEAKINNIHPVIYKLQQED
jgi:hypothetical protein